MKYCREWNQANDEQKAQFTSMAEMCIQLVKSNGKVSESDFNEMVVCLYHSIQDIEQGAPRDPETGDKTIDAENRDTLAINRQRACWMTHPQLFLPPKLTAQQIMDEKAGRKARTEAEKEKMAKV